MMDREEIKKKAIELHKKYRGKIEIKLKVPLETKDDLSLAYTPGVAEPCLQIKKNPELAYEYTNKGNLVAVVTDGSAVLGLGNIGALAGYPVMEGKCALFKKFANVDAIPICLATQDPDEIVKVVKDLEPTFGGINLEDISAPRCFEVEERLKKELGIPVFHDDQHGTAIVVTAGLINALKLVKKDFKDVRVVMSGAGAAGSAITKMLLDKGVKDIIMADSCGVIYEGRKENMNTYKACLAEITNKTCMKCSLKEALKGADIFIGVSAPNLLSADDIRTMNKDAIVFAMANPDPEITPDEAKKGGAKIVATGRSDFPNQINNVLAFPGIFRGALDCRAKQITEEMKMAAADAIASLVPKKELSPDHIIPNAFDPRVGPKVAEYVKKAAKR